MLVSVYVSGWNCYVGVLWGQRKLSIRKIKNKNCQYKQMKSQVLNIGEWCTYIFVGHCDYWPFLLSFLIGEKHEMVSLMLVVINPLLHYQTYLIKCSTSTLENSFVLTKVGTHMYPIAGTPPDKYFIINLYVTTSQRSGYWNFIIIIKLLNVSYVSSMFAMRQ